MKFMWTWALWSHTPEDNFSLKLVFSSLPFNCFQNLHISWSIDYLRWRYHTFLILKVFLKAIWSSCFFSLAAKGRSIYSRGLPFSVNWQKILFPAHKIGRKINGKILAFEVPLYLICYMPWNTPEILIYDLKND